MRTRAYHAWVIFAAIFLLAALLVAVASGCGRGSRGGNVLPQLSTDTGTNTDGEALDMAAIDAELAALKTPEGVDPQLFSHLKKALASALAASGKTASAPPTGEDNAPANLILTPGEGAEWTLSWEYRNLGDYDQNGTIGIADITPLAMHYGASVGGEDPLAAVVDGDLNNVVGIGDITPIAMNYGVNCTGYEVQFWAPGEQDYAQLDTMELEEGTGADQGWLTFAYTFEPVGGNWYRVAPYDAESELGQVSTELQFETPPSPPEITGVTPTSGATGATDVAFSATVNGTPPFEYAWDFGGGADPDTSTAQMPHVTLGAPGVYDTCSVTVTNDSGEDNFPFTLTVGNPPLVVEVLPLTGESGDAVVFGATVTGDEPLTYSWDFGGGATPDTSSEAEPEVTLGADGSYDASVTASNDFGEDFFSFTLEVTVPTIPPTIVSAGPTQGHVDDEVTFSATVTGDEPISFTWDFGGGAAPNTSNERQPDATLSSTAGTYYASVTAENTAGEDSFPFELLVKEASEYDEVEPNNTRAEANALPAFPVYGWYCRLTETTDDDDFFSFSASSGDVLQVAMTLDEPTFNCDLELQNDAGDSLAISEGDTGTEQLDYVFESDGTFYLRCYAVGGGPGEGDYWLDITLEVFVPWDSVQAGDTGSADFGSYCSLLAGATPGIAFYDAVNREPYYATCDSADGLGTWTTYPAIDNLDPDNKTIGTYLNAAMVGGKPAVACPVYNETFATSEAIQLAVCATADGSGPWAVREFDLDSTWDPSVCEVDGRLALAYESYDSVDDESTLSYAINDNADGSGAWTLVSIDPAKAGARYNSLRVAGGYPAIAYFAHETGSGELRFARSLTPDGTAGIWIVDTVDAGTNPVGEYCSMSIVDGRPAIAYFDADTGELKYAINESADGSGSWTYATVGPNDAGYASLRVVDGYPAIAVVGDEAVRFWQADTADGTGGSWDYEVAVTPGMLGSNTCLNISEGQPSIAYYDQVASALRFARRPE